MLAKVIKYKDFLGNERESTLHFNISRAELVRWLIEDEGLIERLQNVQSRTGKEIIAEFDGILKKAFGVRSDDGRRFVKSDEIYNDFVQTAVYDEFFTNIVTSPDEASAFVNGLLPKDLIDNAQKDLSMQKQAGLVPNETPVATVPSNIQPGASYPVQNVQTPGGPSGI